METTYLNTSNRIYLVTFLTTTSKFICRDNKDLITVLKTHDKHQALKSIKVFNNDKDRFERVNKSTLKMFLIWDAESTVFFTKHYYFKTK